MLTVEQLVRTTFSVSLERCAYEIESYDTGGCRAHVGMEPRQVQWFHDEDTAEIVEVAAIRFLVVRSDCRHRGLATQLLTCAHEIARLRGLDYALAFTEVPRFFESAGYEEVGQKAMVYNIGGPMWTHHGIMEWHTVGPEW